MPVAAVMPTDPSAAYRFGLPARRAILWVIVMAAVLSTGCGSESPNVSFEHLHISPAKEELSEFSLGNYSVPIPVVVDRTSDVAQRENRLELDFELYALVTPQHAAELEENWKRHEGKVRDQVISACRDASLEELAEPELATLKARLTDAVQAQLGDHEVRRLLITDVVSQEL